MEMVLRARFSLNPIPDSLPHRDLPREGVTFFKKAKPNQACIERWCELQYTNMKPSYLKTLIGKVSPLRIQDEREGVYLIWDLTPRGAHVHDLSAVCLEIEPWDDI